MPGEIVVGKPVQDTTVSERKTLLSLLLIPPGVKIRPVSEKRSYPSY